MIPPLEVRMTEIVKKAFGEHLAKVRKKAGQTQEGVSLDCDMSLRYYQYLEKGDNNPTMITLFRLADTLKCEPQELVEAAWKVWKKEKKKNR